MSTFLNIDCGGETVTLERTDDDDIIFHGWDEETDLAAVELGFEPSACLIIWNAVNNDALDAELRRFASRGSALIVEALLFVGARVNAQDDLGWTPLHNAALRGHATVVKILLKAGAHHGIRSHRGMTQLQKAAWRGRADIAKILLDAGAKVDNEALRAATQNGHKDVVKIFRAWIAEHGK